MLKLSVIVFRNPEGKLLLQFRDGKAQSDALGWSFFGGVAEGAESPMDAIVREVKEELGLDISPRDVRLLAKRQWISPSNGEEKTVYFYERISPLKWGEFNIYEGAGGAFLSKAEVAAMDKVSLLAKTFVAEYC